MPRSLLGDLFRFMRRESVACGPDLTDGALLKRFLDQRDEVAFEALLQRHGPMVLGVCLRVVGDTHAAEDAFQAIFLVLARKAGAIRKQASVGSWLFGVAQRIAAKARTQAATRRDRERRAANMPQAETLDEVTWQDLRAVLDEEIARLPQKYQAPIVACHLEGKSLDQAAHELGLPKSTLATRLGKALQLLRGLLTRRGVMLSVGALATALTEKATAAQVPELMSINVAKAAARLAAGQNIPAGILSTQAITLAEEALKTMFGFKAKLAMLLVVVGLAVGAGFAGYTAWLGQQSPTRADANQPPVDQAKLPGKDVSGDPLPAGAVARLGEDRWAHDVMARFVAFSPDGKSVVTVNVDRTIRVWEYPSGKEIRRILMPVTDISAGQAFGIRAVLSQDGKTIATWMPEEAASVCLHDVATGKRLPDLKVTTEKVFGLAFSPDGAHLACMTRDGTVRVWDTGKTSEVCSFSAAKLSGGGLSGPNPSGVFYAPDGKSIATGRDREVKLWNPATGAEIRTITGDSIANVRNLAFSPNGKTLAITTGEAIVLVELESGKEVGKLSIPVQLNSSGGGPGLAFDKDGKKIYISDYVGKLFEWEVATGKLLRQAETPGSMGVSLSPDGKSLVRTGTGPPVIDLAGKEITSLDNRTGPIVSLQFTPDGSKLITVNGAADGRTKWSVRTYDAITRKELDTISWPGSSTNLVVSPDGKVLSTEPAPAERKQPPYTLPMALFDVASGKEIGRLPERSVVSRMRFSPDSNLLAVGASQTIKFYEVPDGKLRHTLNLGVGSLRQTLRTMIFSPDSKTFVARADAREMGLWDTATGQRIGSLPLPQGSSLTYVASGHSMHSAAFSPDGRCLVLDMDDGTSVLYELATAQPRQTFGKKVVPRPEIKIAPGVGYMTPDEFRAGSCFAFSPDGTLLTRSGFDRTVHVHDVRTGTELAAFQGHNGAVNELAFTPDGKSVVSGGSDSTVLFWDLTKIKRPAASAQKLKPGDLEMHWKTLADNDAGKAFLALGALTTSPADAVAFLQERVKPAAPLDSKRVEQLLRQVGDETVQVRDQAISELRQIGERIAPALDTALAAQPPLETKRRLEELRDQVTSLRLDGERLRVYRAVEILERIGSSQARQVLQSLATGAPGALVTTSAQAALKR